ncbi:MAG: hypothetical protein AAB452_00980 [Patescibacteria group bacterium]
MDTLRKLIMAVLIAVAVIGGAFGAYSLAYAGKIFPRVSIGIIPVGSLNRADAYGPSKVICNPFASKA